MSTWVLFVILTFNGHSTISMQEFTTEARCEMAALHISTTLTGINVSLDGRGTSLETMCVRK